MTLEKYDWNIPEQPRTIAKFDRYAALTVGWDFSKKFLTQLSANCVSKLSDNIVTIGIAGSFGRLEGSAESDADYIMVVHDPMAAAVSADREQLQSEIAKLGVSPPNKSGVFSEPRTAAQLIDKAGNAEESFDELGKRMLLILESRPLYNNVEFDVLVRKIFEKYAGHVVQDGDKEFAFLANDLMRYFRYICVNYESNFWRQNEDWALRNLKLRHSRIVMYASLLFLIGEASKHRGSEKLDIIRNSVYLTPLERLAWVYDQNHDSSFFRVLGLYNVFIARASEKNWRDGLKGVGYKLRYSYPAFAEMKANSDALVSELVRFLFARRGQWSERFFEYLFF